MKETGHANDEAWQEAIRKMRTVLRLKHLALTTEKTYIEWLRRFYVYLNGKLPFSVESFDVKNFLSHLAVEGKVAASIQNQAFNALLFFFRNVLDKEFGNIEGTLRAKTRQRLPVVLTKSEVLRVLDNLEGIYIIMGELTYGDGLRLQECIRLRIKDIDFERDTITVRAGKGDKDRQTLLPQSVKNSLQAHIMEVRKFYRTGKRMLTEFICPELWIKNILMREKSGDGNGCFLQKVFLLTLAVLE